MNSKLQKFYPIYAINRHRILRDGQGITTLIGFGGCELKCKYCINPGSCSPLGCKQYTYEDILNEVIEDSLYYLATGGGVTFGGGEPLLYSDFIVDFAQHCNKRWKINVETSFNVPTQAIDKVIRIVDEFFVDIKDMNPVIYSIYTRGSNKQVIKNLKYVASAGYAEKVTVRVPLIPNYNTEEDVQNSIEFLNKLGFNKIERITYATNTQELEGNVETRGRYGKSVCETLRAVRQAIIDSTNIDYQLLKCNHTYCESGTCAACKEECRVIEGLIYDKYSKE